jgi:hypothetical protein
MVWEANRSARDGRHRYRCVSTVAGYHAQPIYSVDWSRAGYIATASGDDAIRIFAEAHSDGGGRGGGSGGGAGGPSFVQTAAVSGAHGCDVNCVAWSPTDPLLLASAADDFTVALWRYTPSEDERAANPTASAAAAAADSKANANANANAKPNANAKAAAAPDSKAAAAAAAPAAARPTAAASSGPKPMAVDSGAGAAAGGGAAAGTAGAAAKKPKKKKKKRLMDEGEGGCG